MKNLTKALVLTIWLFGDFACTAQSDTELVAKFHSIAPALRRYRDWRVHMAETNQSDGSIEFIEFQRMSGDTVTNLRAQLTHWNPNHERWDVRIEQSIQVGDYLHRVRLDEFYRMQFHLRYSIKGVAHNEFVEGKYMWMYLNDKLTKGQRNYFEANRDSLTRVKGDDLANLPELDN